MYIQADIIGNTNPIIDYTVEDVTNFNIISMQILCLYFNTSINKDGTIFYDNTEKFYKEICSGFHVDRITIKAVLRNLLAMENITAIIDKHYLEFFNDKIKTDDTDIMYEKVLDCIIGFRFKTKGERHYYNNITDCNNGIELGISYRHNKYNRLPNNSVKYIIFK